MAQRVHQNWREKGIAVMLTAVMLTFIIPMVGLAIDGSILYAIKTKLSTAVDASALAAARSLSTGLDIGSQASTATATAQSFYNANFPATYFFAPRTAPTITVNQSSTLVRTVKVDAYVDAPLFFLRAMNATTTRVNASGQASRRDVNVILVVDRSGSLSLSSSCAPMQAAAVGFVSQFAEARDTLGLVTFGGSYRVDFAPSVNFKTASPTISSVINSVACNGATNSAQGIWQGYKQLVALAQPGKLNVILFFTDGQPNGMTGYFPVKAASSCTDKTNKFGWSSALFNTSVTPAVPVGETGVRNISAPAPPVAADPGSIGGATSSNCAYNSSTSSVAQDIANLPDTVGGDFSGGVGNVSIWGKKSLLTTGGGKARIDDPGTVINAAINALDNAAVLIHQDTTYSTVIYSVGLGGAVDSTPEAGLLQRVSNDPASADFNSAWPAGRYIFVTDSTGLNNAFQAIASEILRLSL